LDGEPGKVIVEARRSGEQSFVAVMNGGGATSVDIPLDFLGARTWKSIQLRNMDLPARGGFVGWIRK
jgi:Glycosyl-hydrolase 97 C-terminal, oligomerisation